MSDNGDGTRYGADERGPVDEMGDAIREEGAGRGGFDPTPYMRQLRGRGGQGQEYLDVKWRLLWLRREHPDAEIVTEHVRIDDGIAIFKATVTVPSGGKATGYGSETSGDFGDFIEKAETKAIGRALNALGYGAQFGERSDEEGTPAPPPPRQAPPAQPAARPARPEPPQPIERPSGPAATAAPPAAEPTPVAPPEPPAVQEPPAPVPFRPAAGSRGPRPVAVPSPAPQTETAATDDPDMTEISWNAFWGWARKLGYRRKEEVESFLGRSVNDLTPGEVRALILERRGEE